MSPRTQTAFDRLLSFRLDVPPSHACTQKQSLVGAAPCQPSVFSPLSICSFFLLLIGHPMAERHTRVEVEGESDRVTHRGGEMGRGKEIKRGRGDER